MRVTMLAAAAALSFSAATVQAGGLLAPEITNVPQAPQMDEPRGSMGSMGVVGPLAGLLLVCAIACGGGDDDAAVDTQTMTALN